jgi:hypothetical protein
MAGSYQTRAGGGNRKKLTRTHFRDSFSAAGRLFGLVGDKVTIFGCRSRRQSYYPPPAGAAPVQHPRGFGRAGADLGGTTTWRVKNGADARNLRISSWTFIKI